MNHKNKGHGPFQRLPVAVIYFVQASRDDTAPIKIGFTRNLKERFRELQVAHWQELKILATIPAARVTEWRLHEKFAAQRVRGEWFRPCPELLAIVATGVLPLEDIALPPVVAPRHTEPKPAVLEVFVEGQVLPGHPPEKAKHNACRPA